MATATAEEAANLSPGAQAVDPLRYVLILVWQIPQDFPQPHIII